MAKKNNRDAILDALEAVIGRHGLANATIDAVAAEAGVSKGGLFYHFPSKKDLLLQLLERNEKRFLDARKEIFDRLPEGPARFLKATLMAMLDRPYKAFADPGNLLPLLDDMELRQRLCETNHRLFREVISESKHPEKAALAMLALNGFKMSELFANPVLKGRFRKKVIDELWRIIDCSAEESV